MEYDDGIFLAGQAVGRDRPEPGEIERRGEKMMRRGG